MENKKLTINLAATFSAEPIREAMAASLSNRGIQAEPELLPYDRPLQREYDCAGDLHRTLALTKLSDNMGTGKVILITSDEQKWEPVDPGSIAKRLWKFACGKQ